MSIVSKSILFFYQSLTHSQVPCAPTKFDSRSEWFVFARKSSLIALRRANSLEKVDLPCDSPASPVRTRIQ
jgi:hypothetical protein